MVISKTLLKNRAMEGGRPSEILADVNNQLCEGNEAELFVTVWLAILDLSTGKVTAANAGHEFPAIRDGKGRFTLLHDKHGFVLAGMEGTRYTDYEFTLEPNGGFFVYTDGVAEASNADNELYGTDRMIEALNKDPGVSSIEFIKNVDDSIKEFVGKAPQFDDITMVGLVWKGGDLMCEKLVVDAVDENMPKLEAFLEENLMKEGCPFKALNQITVAAEEIFVNISHYAYEGEKKGRVQIMMEITKDDPKVMKLRFIDEGAPFNPLENEDPDITEGFEERQIGGLGIFLVKKTMDYVSYIHEDNKNVLTIWKTLEAPEKK